MSAAKLAALILVLVAILRLGSYGFAVPAARLSFRAEWLAALKDPGYQTMLVLIVVLWLIYVA